MKPIDIQLEKYLDYCENVRRMTEQTMYSKRYILETFAKLRLVNDMQDLTNATLHRWASMQLNGTLTGNKVSGRTVNIRMQHIISFCKWLRDMDYEMHVKIALIEKAEEDPPRRMFYTRDEIEFAKRYANDYERMLISLKFDSGLRIFELTNLRLQNINGRHMHIIGKGRKAGDLYMTEETRADLDEWIVKNKITDYLWPSPMYKTSRPYSIDRIRDKMEHAFKHAADIAQMQGNTALADKLRKFYPHSMRHSFATDLQESGARIDETQKLLRHSNSKTTEIYLHGLDGKLDQIYDRLKNKSGAALA